MIPTSSRTPIPCFKLLLLFSAALSLSGCGVVLIGGAAAGTVGYVSGELTATLNSPYEQVVAAADRAIAENSISEISKTLEKYQVSYVLKTVQGDKIEMHIAYTTTDLTNISIRVGIFGDEPLSRQILNEIESRLSP